MFQKLTSPKALKLKGTQAARLRIAKDSVSVAVFQKSASLFPSFYMSMKILLKIFVGLDIKNGISCLSET